VNFLCELEDGSPEEDVVARVGVGLEVGIWAGSEGVCGSHQCSRPIQHSSSGRSLLISFKGRAGALILSLPSSNLKG
jgi:hypothetical protein